MATELAKLSASRQAGLAGRSLEEVPAAEMTQVAVVAVPENSAGEARWVEPANSVGSEGVREKGGDAERVRSSSASQETLSAVPDRRCHYVVCGVVRVRDV